MNPECSPQVALYGDFGDDSETKFGKGRTQTKEIYDPRSKT